MEKEYLLSNSVERYILKKHCLVLAAFPSLIVFGKIESGTKFIESKCFKFPSFESKLLLVAISEIIAFFRGDQDQPKKVFSDISNKEYYWEGNIQRKRDNSDNSKSVTFSFKKFSVKFNLEDLNNFIYLFKRCLLSSLCLKDEEEQFILNVIEHSENEILACKRCFDLASRFVDQVLTETKTKDLSKFAPLIEILRYYIDFALDPPNLVFVNPHKVRLKPSRSS